MRPLFLVTSMLLCAVAMGHGASEEEPYQLPDTVVVTAERFPSPARKVSWPVRTLGLDGKIHSADLSSRLDGVAGIDLTGYGQTGHLSNLLIWGAPSSQILLLRDGRPVYNPATGGFNLAEFSATELERVEIVKGTQSALYGSDAIGGVINLISRKDYFRHYGGGFSAGNNGYLDYYFRMAPVISDWRLNLLHEGAAGDNARTNSGVRRSLFQGELIYAPAEKDWESAVSYRYFRDSVGLPGPVPDPEAIPYYGDSYSFSIVNHQRDFIHSLDARFQIAPRPNAPFSADFNLFYDKRTLEYFGRYAYLGFANDSIDVTDRNRNVGRNSGIEGAVRFDLGEITLSGGLEFLSASSRVFTSTSSTTYDRSGGSSSALESGSDRHHHRDIYAVWSAQSIFLHDRLEFEFSERLQLVNGSESYEAFNSGLKFYPNPDWSLAVAVGSAFRLPSFNDLYWPRDEYSVGNPGLIPEKGNNLALTVTGRIDTTAMLNASLFYRRVKDLITWAPLGEDNSFGSPRWTPSNLNRFRTFGADLGFTFRPSRTWSLELELTAQSARQKNKELVFSGGDGTQRFETRERDAAFVPPLKARAAINAKTAYISGFLEAVFTSTKKAYFAEYSFDSLFNSLISYTEKRLPEAVVLNFGVHRPIGEIFDISLNINDIFDQKPSRQFGSSIKDGDYPSLGREINLAINFNFR
ncbi:MAG: TonB-dependent receptor plug domain-containing protein [bacterium]|jgi:outer membrane cobalamin receptor